MTARVADGLQTDGIAVRGLVIRDGVDPTAMQGILKAASARFPHVAIGGGEAAAFAGRAGTPVALGVDGSGEVGYPSDSGSGVLRVPPRWQGACAEQ